MKTILNKLEKIKSEQENLSATEKLGGDIVKEEFHKGAVFALNMAIDIIVEEIER